MSEKMLRFLGQITDGRSAWAEFYGGVTAAFEANEAAVPVIGVGLLVLVVTLINVRLAVWLGKRWRSQRSAQRVRR